MGETSESIRAHVQVARDIQTKRFSNYSFDIVCNAECGKGMSFGKVHSTAGTGRLWSSNWKGIYSFAREFDSLQVNVL